MDTPDSTTPLKQCIKCGEAKPRTEFSKSKSRNDGLHPICKRCDAARARQHYAENREKRQEYSRQYRERTDRDARLLAHKNYHNKHRDDLNKRSRKYYIENRDAMTEYQRQYRAKNRKILAIKKHKYYAENPDVARASHQRRRARRVGNGGTCTPADVAAIRASQTDTKGRLICWKCGKPIYGKSHLDHWIPLDKGGTSDPGNLHFMHAKCNYLKGAKHPSEIGRLL